jgi:serine/threonine protein kinase
MVMDLLDGETLGQRIARAQQLDLSETATLLLPAVSAIGTAHERGIVHRDLKPDNIFLAKTSAGEIVKVLDFGIAKLSAEAGATSGTETGSTLGTPCYMAPEQAIAEKDIDHRVDVWALGVILYECLSGVRPIEGDSIGQIVMHLMSMGITPLEHLVPALPDDVTALVGRMLSRERSRRPDDLTEVVRVLERHTAVRAPAFGLPGSAPAAHDTEDSLEPGAAQLALGDGAADPQAPTQRVTDSLSNAMASTVRSPPRRRKLAVAATVAAAAALGAWTLTRTSPQPASDARSQSAASESLRTVPHAQAPSGEAKPTPHELLTAAEPSPAPIADAAAKEAEPGKIETSRPGAGRGAARSAPRGGTTAPATSAAPAVKAPPAFKGGLAETPPF